MDSSTTRVILTIAISAAIMIVWYQFMAPQSPPPGTAPTQEQAPAKKKASAPEEVAAASQPAERPLSAGGGPRASKPQGEKTTLSLERAQVSFTDRGAALRSFVLKNPRYKELRNGKLQQVDLVKITASEGLWPLTATFSGANFQLPADAKFKLVHKAERQVRYEWRSDEVLVTKHFVLDKERPVMWMTLQVKNLTAQKLSGRLELNLYNRQDASQKEASITNPYPQISTVLCYVNGEMHQRSAGAITGQNSGCTAAGCGMGEGPVNLTGEVLWIAAGDRYFLTAVVPQDQVEQRRCELQLLQDDVIQSSMLYPEAQIAPGATLSRKFTVFAGPKDLDSIDAVTGPNNQDPHLGEAVEFGWFDFLCRPMLWLMKTFYSWFGNWGVAIILLTIVVKLLTLYWTQKSMRSMREMQRLKPKMDALREKFKDDKERLNQEIMSLYKLHKVNPLGGCLPMLIQMPIWFALYRTLGNAVELYRSGFAGWIHDLTAPDPYYVLPIAMGLAMYGQQAITPQPLEGPQAKMMKYFMPGVFTFMMLWLPSGLTLYIFVNTVLTMIHQWYMNRSDPFRPEDIKTAGGAGAQILQAGPAPRRAGPSGKKRRGSRTR